MFHGLAILPGFQSYEFGPQGIPGLYPRHLPLLSLSRLFDAEQCMTGFDLPSNFDPNPQRIGQIERRRVVPPQKKTHLESSFVSLSTTHGQDSQAVLSLVQQSHSYWTEQ